MIDRIRVRKAIAAFHKNRERITLAKLARTTEHTYAQLYYDVEFHRFAKKRRRTSPVMLSTPSILPTETIPDTPVVEIEAIDNTPQVEVAPEVAEQPQEAVEQVQYSTLTLQVGEWLTVRLKTPVPENIRRWVNSCLSTTQDFLTISDDAQASATKPTPDEPEAEGRPL